MIKMSKFIKTYTVSRKKKKKKTINGGIYHVFGLENSVQFKKLVTLN